MFSVISKHPDQNIFGMSETSISLNKFIYDVLKFDR